jgi:hypothetical protein
MGPMFVPQTLLVLLMVVSYILKIAKTKCTQLLTVAQGKSVFSLLLQY